jgi:hypothetical protein
MRSTYLELIEAEDGSLLGQIPRNLSKMVAMLLSLELIRMIPLVNVYPRGIRMGSGNQASGGSGKNCKRRNAKTHMKAWKWTRRLECLATVE